MPVTFGLKKVKRYEVARRALFVLPVQLLDNSLMECTMNSSTSTGLDLLVHITQRLRIREERYFGLKFINSHFQYQWLALDLPLKQQLSKGASQDAMFVKFSVRFYVQSSNELRDESSRYQFFLQLRNEIIEGALLCSPEQAVLLASYSLQAAYGNFDPDRHSPHHLKNFYLLPKRMSGDEEALWELLLEVSASHRSLHGMAPANAELLYITEAQHLEGYGEEYYAAKDASNNDLLLGTSHNGLTIKHPTGRPITAVSWQNLKSVTQVKRRSICIECHGTGRSTQRHVQIFLENGDFASYVLSNITLQQDFYLNNLAAPDGFGVVNNPPGHKPLLFRPDPFSSASVRLPFLQDNLMKSDRPDILPFARDDDPSRSSESPEIPDNRKERSPRLYSQSPPFSTLTEKQAVQSRTSYPWPSENQSRSLDLVESATYSLQNNVLTTSTPDLRHGNSSQVRLGCSGVSCSTPDLLLAIPQRRLINHVLRPSNSDVASNPLMMRQMAVKDLSSPPSLLGNHQKVRDQPVIEELPTFSARTHRSPPLEPVIEVKPPRKKYEQNQQMQEHRPEVVSVRRNISDIPVHAQAKENTTTNSVSPEDRFSTASATQTLNRNAARPLLMAAMNGLVPSDPDNPLGIQTTDFPDAENVTKDACRKDLEDRLSSGTVLIEFEQIPKKRLHNGSCQVALLPENASRNRSADVVPYDDTRVRLLHPSKRNPMGYINASEVVLKCQSLERRYIATQDPLTGTDSTGVSSTSLGGAGGKNTKGLLGTVRSLSGMKSAFSSQSTTQTQEDFLSMMTQYCIDLVVVLSENSAVPWAGFLDGTTKDVSMDGFHLKLLSLSNVGDYTIVCFWLFDRRSKLARRKTWALHYHAWDDQGVPKSVRSFTQMVQEVEGLRVQSTRGNEVVKAGLVLVLCKTGAGRIGLWILFDFMKLCLDHNQQVDLARVLTHMRTQRMHMVQTVSQYRFVYTALVHYLSTSRLI